jgi:hypothetical protein
MQLISADLFFTVFFMPSAGKSLNIDTKKFFLPAKFSLNT